MLTTLDDLKAWAFPDLTEATKDDTLNACIAAASAWVQSSTGRTLERATHTQVFSGYAAQGAERERLRLPRERHPILHVAPDDLLTVSEDGIALVVSASYDDAAAVTVLGANQREGACWLIRRSGYWSPGVNNITVTYKAGYLEASMPAEVKMLANEVALLYFRTPSHAGKATVTKAGRSISVDRQLSPASKALLEAMRRGVW